MNQPVMTLLPMSEIDYDEEFNCRGHIIPMDVIDLAKDIEKHGLLQPVVVTEYTPEEVTKKGFKYRLIAGFRRYTAHRVIKREEIMATVRPPMDELNARATNLAENLQRKDLTILQEAQAIRRFLDLGLSENQTGELLGMSKGWVQVRFLLLKLPDDIQQEIGVGMFSQRQIRDVYTHYNKSGREGAVEAIKCIKDKKLRGFSDARAKPKNPKKSKRIRKRPEMFEMMTHLQETVGNGLHTRVLAWCAGEIATGELYGSVAAYDAKFGDGTYTAPSE